MSMTIGTATMTLSSTGLVVTAAYGGSGMALLAIQARGPAFLAQINAAHAAAATAGANAQPPFTSLPATASNASYPSLASYQAAASALAAAAVVDATWVVNGIQASAVATISTSLGGLQTSASSGSPTTAPSVAHTIPIS